MNNSELKKYFEDIYLIREHTNQFAPIAVVGTADFRAEIGGLMTIKIASSYENAVKAVLIDYSTRHNSEFGGFVERNFEKLNSRISIGDLNRYAKVAGATVYKVFSEALKHRKERYERLAKVEISKSYEQILSWRHAYAHSGSKETTLEEALRKHREGSAVLLSFAEAFESGCP